MAYQACLLDNARLQRPYVLSQFSGVLAAHAINLPPCSSLTSMGNMALFLQYRNVTVEIGATYLDCGPQPEFVLRERNHTVDRDGHTVRPASPCFWRDGIANFNGAIHQYRNGSWHAMDASTHATQARLHQHFNLVVETSASHLLPLSTMLNQLGLVAEL